MTLATSTRERGREAASRHVLGIAHQLIEMDFGCCDEGACPAASFYDALALQASQGVAGGHETHFMQASEFAFGFDGIPGLHLSCLNL
jgi:hypothetical protein